MVTGEEDDEPKKSCDDFRTIKYDNQEYEQVKLSDEFELLDKENHEDIVLLELSIT